MGKLDSTIQSRMLAASQAAKAREASKTLPKRDPGYDRDTMRKLKKAGRDARSEQPESVLKAIDQVPDAQTSRIVDMKYQDAPSKEHKSERAVMVQQVHPVIGHLSLRAQSGWLEYAELWDSAQPCVVMEYGERHHDQRVGASQQEKDPAWLRARTRLREFEARLDRRIVRRADEFMLTKGVLSVEGCDKRLLDAVGKALAKVFESS